MTNSLLFSELFGRAREDVREAARRSLDKLDMSEAACERHLVLRQLAAWACLSTLAGWESDNTFTFEPSMHGGVTLRLIGPRSAYKSLLARLIRAGFKRNPLYRTDKTSACGTMFHEDGASVFVSYTSTSCRMVKTGVATKVVETPIYSVVCE